MNPIGGKHPRSIPRQLRPEDMTLDQLCVAKEIAHGRMLAAKTHRAAMLATGVMQRIEAEAEHRGYRLRRSAEGRPYVAERMHQWWQNPGGAVAHAYHPGPGSGDASLCGVLLDPDAEPYPVADRCARCVRSVS